MNSYNDGEVVYSKADYATPYVGGLVGSTWDGADIQNSVNLGSVGIESGAEPSESAIKCLGALIGYQQVTSITKYSYYPQSILNGKAMGANGAAAGATVQGFDEEFKFSTGVTYDSDDYTEAVSALNAWITGESESINYLSWTLGANGPELVFE